MELFQQPQTIDNFIEWQYETYKGMLLRMIRKYIRDNIACEDVFQEVFIKIIKKAEMLHKLSTPKLEAYITLVACGSSIDYIRKHSKDANIEDNIYLLETSQPSWCTQTTGTSIAKTNLFLMLRNFSAEDQTLLIGKYYIGLSINELADITKLSPIALRSKLHRAKKRVYDKWSQSGLNLGDFINEE